MFILFSRFTGRVNAMYGEEPSAWDTEHQWAITLAEAENEELLLTCLGQQVPLPMLLKERPYLFNYDGMQLTYDSTWQEGQEPAPSTPVLYILATDLVAALTSATNVSTLKPVIEKTIKRQLFLEKRLGERLF